MSHDFERGPGDRSALARLTGLDAATFAREHWGLAPRLTPAADLCPDGGDLADLFSEAAVDELVSRRGLRTPFIRLAQDGAVLAPQRYTGSGGFGAEVGDQVDSAKVLGLFAAGATIVLQGLHRLWPPLIDFTRALVDDLGHPVQVNAYCTPAANRGFDPHYDVHDVFVVQVAGEKRWRIHAPVHEHPLRDQPWSDHRAAVGDRAAEEPVIDAVLHPGDVLYLPRGWIHSAEALGGTSVHLTLGVASYTRDDVLAALAAELRDVPELRRPLPLGVDWSDRDAVRGLVEQTLEALRATLGTDSDTDSDSPDLDARLDAVAGRLAGRLRVDTRPEPVPALATVAAVAALDEKTQLRWRGGLDAVVSDLPDGRVRIAALGIDLTLPGEAAPAVRRLAEGRPVLVGDLPDLDPESALVVARRLLREAVVVVTT